MPIPDRNSVGTARAAHAEPPEVSDTEVVLSSLQSILSLANTIENKTFEVSDRLFGSAPHGSAGGNKAAPVMGFFAQSNDLMSEITTVLEDANATLVRVLARIGAPVGA